MIILDSEKIEDPYARESLEKVSEVINGNPLMTAEFKSIEIDVTDITSTVKVRHQMKFTPTDVFVSWVSNSSAIVIKYDLIDETNIAFTSSAICKLRLIVGRMN